MSLDNGRELLLVRVCLRLESEAMMRVPPCFLEVTPSGRGASVAPRPMECYELHRNFAA